MNIANEARRVLIRFGKVQPFILCAIVCLVYLETVVSLSCGYYLYYNDCTIVNTPISFYIAKYVEYDWLYISISLIVSLSIEVCKWNIYATIVLIIQLIEKSYFDFELEQTSIYIICAANIIASGYLTYRGIKQLLTN